MKKSFFFGLLLFPLTLLAQGILDREVGEFHQIKVYDLIEVNLIQSDRNKILIKGHNVDDIRWTNTNGTLKLRMKLDKKFQGEDMVIEVFHTQLDLIDANEGSRIVCNELVRQPKIELRAQEGAKIHIGMDVDHVDVRAVTGGIVEASGLAKSQKVVLNTGGIFEGRELRTSSTDIKISAGGEAEVFASDVVDINLKAGGDVTVYGNPDKVHKKTFVGGNIRIVE